MIALSALVTVLALIAFEAKGNPLFAVAAALACVINLILIWNL